MEIYIFSLVHINYIKPINIKESLLICPVSTKGCFVVGYNVTFKVQQKKKRISCQGILWKIIFILKSMKCFQCILCSALADLDCYLSLRSVSSSCA